MRQWIKQFLFWVSSIAIIAIASLFALTHFYEKEIVTLVSGEINKQLTAPLKVAGVKLDLFTSFPDAAVKLEDAKLGTDQAPILELKAIKFEFSLIDLLRKKINITSLHLGDGEVNLLRTENGWNAKVWRDKKESSDDKVKFDIRKIAVNQVALSLEDKENVTLKAFVESLNILSENVFSSNTIEGNFTDFSLTIGDELWLDKQQLSARLIGEISDDFFTWKDAILELKDLVVNSSGKFAFASNHYQILVKNKGNKLVDLSAIPPIYNLIPKELAGKGFFTVSGEIDQASQLKIALDLTLKEGVWQLDDFDNIILDLNNYKVAWKDIKGQGTIGRLTIADNNFTAQLKSSEIALNGKIGEDYTGIANYRGDIAFAIKNGNITFNGAEGKLKLQDFKIKDQPYYLVEAETSIKDRELRVDKSAISFNEIAYNFSGGIILPSDLEKGRYSIRGYLESNLLDIAQLKSLGAKSKGKSGPSPSFKIDLDYYVKSIKYEQINLSENLGKITWSSDGDLNFKGFNSALNNGNLQGDLEIAALPNKSMQFDGNVTLDDIEISSLFKDFKEFGQELFNHKHIDGQLDANLEFSAILSPDFELDAKSLQANGNILISKGQLHNFPLFKDLASALRANLLTNALVNIKKLSTALEEVSFDQLSNRIEIENGNIHFPKMAVKSNVFNLNASGKHSLDHSIDYRLDFLLADALNIGDQTENSKGKRIFLRITGSTEDPIFSLDKEAPKEYKAGKAPINIFEPVVEEKPKLIVEREDQTSKTTTEKPSITAKDSSDKKKKPKWLRQEKEEKTKVEIDFSDEDF